MSELNNTLFHPPNHQIASSIQCFINDYEIYNLVLKKYLQNDCIWTFLKLNTFTDCKTNNNIEGFHSMLESVTSRHNSFQTKDSLCRALIHEIERYNERSSIATERNCASTLNMDIKDLLAPQSKSELIILTIMYKGKQMMNEQITKLVYDAIRELLNIE